MRRNDLFFVDLVGLNEWVYASAALFCVIAAVISSHSPIVGGLMFSAISLVFVVVCAGNVRTILKTREIDSGNFISYTKAYVFYLALLCIGTVALYLSVSLVCNAYIAHLYAEIHELFQTF